MTLVLINLVLNLYVFVLPVVLDDEALHGHQQQSVQLPNDSEAVGPHNPTVWTCTRRHSGRAEICNGLNNFSEEVI